MNDDTNVEPVEMTELSPTRAELIARVRARGRQIRARRRLAVAGLTALVVLAIAAPAIAIGARSSSRSVPPATVARSKGSFRIALITDLAAPPCRAGTLMTPVTAACASLGRILAIADDVQSASARYDATRGWFVKVQLSQQAIARLRAAAPGQAAIVVAGKVWGVPRLSADISVIDIVTDRVTREEAIALATAISGEPPARVDPDPVLSVRIELPGDTIVAGSELKGTLVIDNATGEPIDLSNENCHAKFAVTLKNATFTNEPLYTTDCRMGPWIIAPGVSRWNFTLIGSYYVCADAARPVRGEQICPPGPIGSRALPVGAYEAVLTSTSPGFLPAPAPVPVHVVAAPGGTKP